MIIDSRNEFADATAVGAPNNSTVNVGNQIDLEVARDIGNGQTVYAVFQVDTAITSGGAATVQFQLASDASDSIATDGTQTIHYTSKAFPVASLTAGFTVVVALPLEDPDYERYLGVQVVETAGQALTAGKINAFLTLDPHGWQAYADALASEN